MPIKSAFQNEIIDPSQLGTRLCTRSYTITWRRDWHFSNLFHAANEKCSMGLTSPIHCLLPQYCRQGATWVCCLVAALKRCLVASYCLSKWLLMMIFVKTEVRQGGVNDKQVRYSCSTCYFPLCHFRLKVRLRTQQMRPWVEAVKRKSDDHLKEERIMRRYCDMTVLKSITYSA